MLSLWKLGVQSETLNTFEIINDTCNIIVKTPVGKTSEFQVRSIVQQGSVTGGVLCAASTGEITGENLGSGTQIGQCNIKALVFVDDIAGANNGVPSTYQSHNKVIWFSSKKRLTLNGPKCMIMPINLRSGDIIPRLKIDGKPLQIANKAQYLGDIFNRRGNNWDLIQSRVNKGQSCLVSSMSLCSDITLGVHSIETLLLLYRCVFIAVVLYNAQAWSNIVDKQMKALRTIQLKFIKRIFHVPASTPNAVTYLDTGNLPIDSTINIKQLNFLHHILGLDGDDPVKCAYQGQIKFEFESNWGKEIREIREKYKLTHSDNEIAMLSKLKWKEIVLTNVSDYWFEVIHKEFLKLKHVNIKEYTRLEQQEYLRVLPPQQARCIFQIRAGVIDLKAVRKYWYKDSTCRLCGEGEEDINHVVNSCSKITRTSHIEHIQTDDIGELQQIARRCMKFAKGVKNS